MAENVKSPSRPTIKRLFALSGNRCAFENCESRIVDQQSGSIIGEVCHIKGEKPTAPRYDPRQDDQSRHGFENLILLCNVHHKIIDDNPHDFPAELLQAMKGKQESLQEGKEALEDAQAEAFAIAIESHFGDNNNVVQAPHVSGGQVANTIINYPPPPTDDKVILEGKASISGGIGELRCPFIDLKLICRSKRAARIRRVIASLLGHGFMQGMQEGFDKSFGYNPHKDSPEELRIELIPAQNFNSNDSFVVSQDDAARFLLPMRAPFLAIFQIHPPAAMCLKVEFVDDTEQIVLPGDELKNLIEGMFEIGKTMGSEPSPIMMKMEIRVQSTTAPDLGAAGTVNQKPVHLGLRVGVPPTSEPQSSPIPKEKMWFERRGNKISYPGVRQGPHQHCVFAAIAGAVNHLVGKTVWTSEQLYHEHMQRDGSVPDFGVADTAIRPVHEIIEKIHHHKNISSKPLTPELIRNWLDSGGVVILSMERRIDSVSNAGGWHMFTLISYSDGLFQVWDTNGFEGFINEEEIVNGFFYPNRWFFMPHKEEDTLILKPKGQ